MDIFPSIWSNHPFADPHLNQFTHPLYPFQYHAILNCHMNFIMYHIIINLPPLYPFATTHSYNAIWALMSNTFFWLFCNYYPLFLLFLCTVYFVNFWTHVHMQAIFQVHKRFWHLNFLIIFSLSIVTFSSSPFMSGTCYAHSKLCWDEMHQDSFEWTYIKK